VAEELILVTIVFSLEFPLWTAETIPCYRERRLTSATGGKGKDGEFIEEDAWGRI
jgi:hypothetical protein